MPCCLFGVKALPEPLSIGSFGPKIEIHFFHWWKYILKCNLSMAAIFPWRWIKRDAKYFNYFTISTAFSTVLSGRQKSMPSAVFDDISHWLIPSFAQWDLRLKISVSLACNVPVLRSLLRASYRRLDFITVATQSYSVDEESRFIQSIFWVTALILGDLRLKRDFYQLSSLSSSQRTQDGRVYLDRLVYV